MNLQLPVQSLPITTIECWNYSDSVLYIFHFIIGYEKKPAELQLLKKNMAVIVFRNQNRQNEIQPNQMVTYFNLI